MNGMRKWAIGGALIGTFIALVVFAPATWLAALLRDATDQRLLLSDARGTVWRGSALLVLTGGPDSRSASVLPGRLQWRLGLDGTGLALRAQQDCCIDGELHMRLAPGFGRMRLELPGRPNGAGAAPASPIGHWPASWLVGLGTPWNTLQPSGTLQFSSPGLVLEQVQGRWRFTGQAVIELQSIASRVSTLPELGNYRVVIQGDAAAGDAAGLQLNTTSGALQLNGSGQWAGSKLRFNGRASAAPGFEAALSNLLNLIGRRQGAAAVISIG